MSMMSDHNSSDLAPQRQEMSVENVSSGLVPQGQKASDYDNSDPVYPKTICLFLQKRKDKFVTTRVRISLQSLYLKNFKSTHGLDTGGKSTMIKHECIIF
ncbi:hypothetical protein Tco_0541346 [Tanacetum coccineum]